MVTNKVVILEAGRLYGKAQISEEACQKMVEKWREDGSKPLPLTFLISKAPVGTIVAIEYNEVEKKIYATIDLNLDVYAGIDPIQKIDLPLGEIKVIEGVLRSGVIVPRRPEGGK